MSSRDGGHCAVCGSDAFSILYAGPIRDGRFGTLTPAIEVRRCERCGTGRLSECLEDCGDYYETERYREQVDGDATTSAFREAHDAEQAARVAMAGTGQLRNAVIADVGCGAGSFLDAVSGFAAECIAVEPAAHFRPELERRGFDTYAYAADAARARTHVADLVTCFSVIEHVEDPVGLLRDIGRLLKPDGRLVLSTPNSDDALLNILGADYQRFFYRKAHLYYFDAESVTSTLTEAGFTSVRVRHFQRFGLGNALGWVRDRQPVGELSIEAVTPAVDAVWKAELERTGASDYLCVEARAGAAL